MKILLKVIAFNVFVALAGVHLTAIWMFEFFAWCIGITVLVGGIIVSLAGLLWHSDEGGDHASEFRCRKATYDRANHHRRVP